MILGTWIWWASGTAGAAPEEPACRDAWECEQEAWDHYSDFELDEAAPYARAALARDGTSERSLLVLAQLAERDGDFGVVRDLAARGARLRGEKQSDFEAAALRAPIFEAVALADVDSARASVEEFRADGVQSEVVDGHWIEIREREIEVVQAIVSEAECGGELAVLRDYVATLGEDSELRKRLQATRTQVLMYRNRPRVDAFTAWCKLASDLQSERWEDLGAPVGEAPEGLGPYAELSGFADRLRPLALALEARELDETQRRELDEVLESAPLGARKLAQRLEKRAAILLGPTDATRDQAREYQQLEGYTNQDRRFVLQSLRDAGQLSPPPSRWVAAAGAGVGIVGAVILASTGAARDRVAQSESCVPASETTVVCNEEGVRSYRNHTRGMVVGGVLLGAGAATTVAGTVVFTIEQNKRRREWDSRDANASVTP